MKKAACALVVFMTIVLVAVAADQAKKKAEESKSQVKKLLGEWKVIRIEVEGEEVTESHYLWGLWFYEKKLGTVEEGKAGSKKGFKFISFNEYQIDATTTPKRFDTIDYVSNSTKTSKTSAKTFAKTKAKTFAKPRFKTAVKTRAATKGEKTEKTKSKVSRRPLRVVVRQAIYSIEGDTLKVCWTRRGTLRPTEFTTKKGDGRTLFTLKWQKKLKPMRR